MEIIIDNNDNNPTIGSLRYGTFVSGIPSHPDIIYQKLDKQEFGRDIKLSFPPNVSILFNVSSGRIRAVPGNTRVRVFDGTMKLNQVKHTHLYQKEVK